MEKILFPMQVLNITTKMGEATHAGSFAIDIAGRNSGIENAYAPFTGVIKKKWANGNSVWLESVSPVAFADGTTDYATILLTHDNNITDLSVGQVIGQGQAFYQEGTAGNATGNHIHLNVGRGKFSGSGWTQNGYGYWVINNEVRPYDAFYLSGTEVVNGAGYPWKKLNKESTMASRDSIIRLFNLGLHRSPSEDDIKARLPYTDDQIAQELLASQEWLGQNHVAIVAYPQAVKDVAELRLQLATEDQGEAAKKLQAIKDALK